MMSTTGITRQGLVEHEGMNPLPDPRLQFWLSVGSAEGFLHWLNVYPCIRWTQSVIVQPYPDDIHGCATDTFTA